MKNQIIQKRYNVHDYIINGENIRTYHIGNGENIIIALPAFPSPGLIYFLNFSNLVEKNIKIIALDIPGWIGGSSINYYKNKKFSFDLLVDLVEQIIIKLKVEKFSLLGYSFGGSLSIKLAEKYIDQIKKLVLVSSVANSQINNSTFMLNLYKIADKWRISPIFIKSVLLLKKRWVLKIMKEMDVSIEDQNYLELILGNVDYNILSHSIKELICTDLTYSLKQIKDKGIKTMVINSQNEGDFFIEQSNYIRKNLKNPKSIYLKGTHNDYILKPDEIVIKEILKFYSDDIV